MGTLDKEFMDDFTKITNDASIPEADDYHVYRDKDDTFDGYLKMKVNLPHGKDDEYECATVKRRAVSRDGVPIGTPHKFPLLDTYQYEVEKILFCFGTDNRECYL